MSRLLQSAGPAVLTFVWPSLVLAHGGHLAELAGHAHWAGLAALAGAAAIGAAAAKLRGKNAQATPDGSEDSDSSAEPEATQ